MTYKLTQGWPQHIESGAFVNPETNQEYLAWLAEGNVPEPADQPSPADLIKQQISALDAQITPRRIREAFADPTWMTDLEAQIAQLRSQL